MHSLISLLGFALCSTLVRGLPMLEVSPEDRIDLSHLGPEIYGIPDEKTGEKLKEWKIESGTNPEEVGEYMEGDIIMPKPLGRSGIAAESARWPNATVPYEINGRFSKFLFHIFKD